MFYYIANEANIIIVAFLYIFTFLLCHGDIELNPGPKGLKPNYISICHWNLNGISAHNFLNKFWENALRYKSEKIIFNFSFGGFSC